ncbi:MAG: MopE-related protein [Sandaracinaceae bacterium]
MSRVHRLVVLVLFFSACGGPDGPPDAASDSGLEPADTGPSCSEDMDCDDGLFCNGEEVCAMGRCVPGDAPDCDDGIECTIDTCDETRDACESEAPDADDDGFGDATCVDGAGAPLGTDCDDANADRFPGNFERCDAENVDEDCDPTTFGAVDGDGDGQLAARCCNEMDGALVCGTDCDDTRAGISPLVPEVCNGLDDDCDGTVDEGVALMGFVDGDYDGVGDDARAMIACADAPGFATVGGDCDDGDAAVRPGFAELCDGDDNDCDGTIDESPTEVDWYGDRDGDGFGASSSGVTRSCMRLGAGFSILSTDCDDDEAGVNPASAELCNGVDDDCNGAADFRVGVNDLEDDDGDGVVDLACGPPFGEDCDDADPATGGGALEICDGRDNDCDMIVDEGATDAVWFRDVDGDGYGSPSSGAMVSCAAIAGYVARGGDCNDGDAAISPAAAETCDGRDQDCDSAVDEVPASSTCALSNAAAACFGGTCRVDFCVAGFDDCNGDDRDGCEQPIDVITSCGNCGNDCSFLPGADTVRCAMVGAGYACEIDACAAGFDDCNGSPRDGCETQTDSDPSNCGGCGVTCGGGVGGRSECLGGTCSLTCDPGLGDCDGVAANGCEARLDTTAACGSCGNACTPGANVATTRCEPDPFGGFRCAVDMCDPGFDDCDGNPTNGCEAATDSDPMSCGGCGFMCPPDNVCMGGACVIGTCPPGREDCNLFAGDGCESDTATDPSHCGGCGVFCGPSTNCVSGSCVCVSGAQDCNMVASDGCEVFTDGDASNCGSCGNRCPPDNLCSGGTCVLGTCPLDRADCNLDPSDGCETFTDSDPSHCGGCGTACGANAFCDFGTCRCAPDFEDCDLAPANGCETNLRTDPMNCGTCGMGCGMSAACIDRACVTMCTGSLGDCDGMPGCETDLDADAGNCGACGVSCGAAGSCVAGDCDDVAVIAAGSDFTCATRANGGAACWGEGGTGQLGDGMTMSHAVPNQASTPPLVGVGAGLQFACGLEEFGVPYCWGENSYGQMGDGAPSGPRPTPGPVMLTADPAILLAVGGSHACVVTSVGEVWCWGRGDLGQMGNGTTTLDNGIPVQATLPAMRTAVGIAAGEFHTCALLDDDTIHCWGNDLDGQLGTSGAPTNSATPVQTTAAVPSPRSIAAGGGHTCVVNAARRLYCWGRNGSGQSSGSTSPSSIVQPTLVGGAINVTAVGTGKDHTCYLGSLSRVWCLGDNSRGQLGQGGTFPPGMMPVQVQPPLNATQLSVGAAADHTCAVDPGGRAWCWGYDMFGQIGDGMPGGTENNPRPVSF